MSPAIVKKHIPEDIDRIATDIVRTDYSKSGEEPDWLLYEAIANAILTERERSRTGTTWNHDLTTAPRGHMVIVVRNTRTKDGIIRIPVDEFEPDHIWLATKCGKVTKSYWIPATDRNEGRWAGFATKEEPVAWQPFIVPEHPFSRSSSGRTADFDSANAGSNPALESINPPSDSGLPKSGAPGLASAGKPLSDREYVEIVGEHAEREREFRAAAAETVAHLGLEDVGGGV